MGFWKYIAFPVLLSIAYYFLRGKVNLEDFLKNTYESQKIEITLGEGESKLFTKEELSKYIGENDGPIYLSILGSIFDVTKGRKHYGEGCSYSFFTGKDASKAFVSGDFETYDESSDDVIGLEPSDIAGLDNWVQFYHKDYTFVGKLIGRFYDSNGEKTEYFKEVDKILEDVKEKRKEEEKLQDLFPSCNLKWTKETGTKVWCTSDSNGKERGWTGVPRKYYEPAKTYFRCACVEEHNLENPNLKQYDDCDPKATTCYYSVD
ncbi:CYB5D2.2 family protein [Megaselia abdita]